MFRFISQNTISPLKTSGLNSPGYGVRIVPWRHSGYTVPISFLCSRNEATEFKVLLSPVNEPTASSSKLEEHLLRLLYVLCIQASDSQSDTGEIMKCKFLLLVSCINLLLLSLFVVRSVGGVGSPCEDGKFFDQSRKQSIPCHECKKEIQECFLCCKKGSDNQGVYLKNFLLFLFIHFMGTAADIRLPLWKIRSHHSFNLRDRLKENNFSVHIKTKNPYVVGMAIISSPSDGRMSVLGMSLIISPL